MPMLNDAKVHQWGGNPSSFIMAAFHAGVNMVCDLPWKTIFLLGLAASASIVSAHAENELSEPIVIDSICSETTFEVWNSVPNGYVGYEGQRMFKSCKTNPTSKQCKEDQKTGEKLKYYNPHEKEMRKTTAAIHQRMADWVGHTDPEIHEISHSLNTKDAELFHQLIEDISELHYRNMDALSGLKGGFCAQHTNKAMRRFLNANKKFNLQIKFQIIELSDDVAMSQDAGSFVDMDMKSHAFGLVNSNIEDVSIKRDPKKVGALLNNMHGILCDTHQHRTGEIKQDDSGLYSAAAGWDSIKIKTMTLDLSAITYLPAKARNYICELVTSLKLPITTTSVCGFFTNKEQTDKDKKAAIDKHLEKSIGPDII